MNMMKMRYIDQWLSGLGLDHIIPKLTEHGITTPKKLAQLNLRDMYEQVGIEDAEDRKKLFYLIQRLNTIFKKEQSVEEAVPDEQTVMAPPPEPVAPPPGVAPVLSRGGSNVQVSPLRARPSEAAFSASPLLEKSLGASGASVDSDDDLRVLRKQRKATTEYGTAENAKSVNSAHSFEHNRPQVAESSESILRAPSPIVPPAESSRHSLGGDILGRAERASGGRLSTSYHPSSFNGVGQGSSDVAIGSVTAKVLARRQQREQAMLHGHEAAGQRHVHHSDHRAPFPQEYSSAPQENQVPKRQSILEVNIQNRGNASYSNRGAESPPPPAPPLSNSSSGPIEGRFSFQKEPMQQYSVGQTNPHQSYAEYDKDIYEDDVEAEDEEFNNTSSGGRPTASDYVDMAIRVVVRKRPISRSELAKDDNDVVDIEDGSVFVHEPKTKVDLTKVIETHVFQFDDAFGHEVSNEEIYSRTVKHLMGVLFDLGKASCFAYGQTGSGKTFTMMGSDPASPATVKKNAGLYVLAARDIFSRIRQPQFSDLLVFVSCFEIYSGKLFDLLNDRNVIKCLEDSKQQVQLPGLTEHKVGDVDSLLNLMAQAHGLRSIGSTGANMESSRSHQVLQIVVRKPDSVKEAGKARRIGGFVTVKAPKKPEYGKLSFIDLAGSERGVDTTNNSKQTRLEGAEINTSLLALKEVIRSLERKHGHTPFRGSKLTQVLKDSFVGDKTRTCMVACISPSHANCEHTLNTLRYADRVKEHQLSNNSSGGDAIADSRRSPTQQMMDFESYDLPSSKSSRPSTAILAEESSRSISVGIGRPSTAASAFQNQPSSRELDRIRREADGRRRPNQGNDAPADFRRPATTATASSGAVGFSRRESKIPASPSTRNRQKSIGQRAASPNSPLRGAVKPSPARSQHQRQNTVDSRDAWEAAPAVNNNAAAVNPFASLQTASSTTRTSSSFPDIRKDLPLRRPSCEASPPARVPSPSPDRAVESDIFLNKDNDKKDAASNAQNQESELLHKTVDLLSAHKLAIAEMVEVMKDEMGLVQDMEASEERDSERYAEVLYNILCVKTESINILQQQLNSFREYRKHK